MSTLKEEGQKIAEQLGHGVIYKGPWLPYGPGGEFYGHFFEDDAVTESSFVASTLEEAKEALTSIRKGFGAELPVFPDNPNGTCYEEQQIEQLMMFGLSRYDAERFLSATKEERMAMIKKAGVMGETPAFYYESLMPMSPEEGPPLPRKWGIRWPWR